MKVARETVEAYLTRKFRQIIIDRKKSTDFYNQCMDKYNIPGGLVADFCNGNRSLEEANPFILFALTDCMPEKKEFIINKYFTENEIQMYSSAKYEENKNIFPIKFRVVQVSRDQWIGKINLQTLVSLRDTQLISYNIDTQRTLKKIVRGESEYYEVSLNKKSLREIRESVADGTYIPTPLTFNIQPDANINFEYNDKTATLVINYAEALDITDGYHRFVALMNNYDAGTISDFTMELRITMFSTEKANQFIYQEDQKTKMKKMDSESYNMKNPANAVVMKLNESPKCNLQGLIKRNGGIINSGEMANVVKFFYFRDTKKSQERFKIIEATNELTDFFNYITERDARYLEESYNFNKILTVLCVFEYYKKTDDNSDMMDIMPKVIEKVKNTKDKRFTLQKVTTPIVNTIYRYIEEVREDV